MQGVLPGAQAPQHQRGTASVTKQRSSLRKVVVATTRQQKSKAVDFDEGSSSEEEDFDASPTPGTGYDNGSGQDDMIKNAKKGRIPLASAYVISTIVFMLIVVAALISSQLYFKQFVDQVAEHTARSELSVTQHFVTLTLMGIEAHSRSIATQLAAFHAATPIVDERQVLELWNTTFAPLWLSSLFAYNAVPLMGSGIRWYVNETHSHNLQYWVDNTFHEIPPRQPRISTSKRLDSGEYVQQAYRVSFDEPFRIVAHTPPTPVSASGANWWPATNGEVPSEPPVMQVEDEPYLNFTADGGASMIRDGVVRNKWRGIRRWIATNRSAYYYDTFLDTARIGNFIVEIRSWLTVTSWLEALPTASVELNGSIVILIDGRTNAVISTSCREVNYAHNHGCVRPSILANFTVDAPRASCEFAENYSHPLVRRLWAAFGGHDVDPDVEHFAHEVSSMKKVEGDDGNIYFAYFAHAIRDLHDPESPRFHIIWAQRSDTIAGVSSIVTNMVNTIIIICVVLVISSLAPLIANYRNFIQPMQHITKCMGRLAKLDFSFITDDQTCFMDIFVDGSHVPKKRFAIGEVQALYDTIYSVSTRLEQAMPFIPKTMANSGDDDEDEGDLSRIHSDEESELHEIEFEDLEPGAVRHHPLTDGRLGTDSRMSDNVSTASSDGKQPPPTTVRRDAFESSGDDSAGGAGNTMSVTRSMKIPKSPRVGSLHTKGSSRRRAPGGTGSVASTTAGATGAAPDGQVHRNPFITRGGDADLMASGDNVAAEFDPSQTSLNSELSPSLFTSMSMTTSSLNNTVGRSQIFQVVAATSFVRRLGASNSNNSVGGPGASARRVELSVSDNSAASSGRGSNAAAANSSVVEKSMREHLLDDVGPVSPQLRADEVQGRPASGAPPQQIIKAASGSQFQVLIPPSGSTRAGSMLSVASSSSSGGGSGNDASGAHGAAPAGTSAGGGNSGHAAPASAHSVHIGTPDNARSTPTRLSRVGPTNNSPAPSTAAQQPLTPRSSATGSQHGLSPAETPIVYDFSDEMDEVDCVVAHFILAEQYQCHNLAALAGSRVANGVKRAFVAEAIDVITKNKGWTLDVGPTMVSGVWFRKPQIEVKACTAAIEFHRRLYNALLALNVSVEQCEIPGCGPCHPFPAAVGIVGGQSLVGVIGTNSKKGLAVGAHLTERARIVADAAVTIRASTLTTAEISEKASHVALFRLAEIVTIPPAAARTLRSRQTAPTREHLFHCLAYNRAADAEWQYFLEAIASEANASLATGYNEGITAFIEGRYAASLAGFHQYLRGHYNRPPAASDSADKKAKRQHQQHVHLGDTFVEHKIMLLSAIVSSASGAEAADELMRQHRVVFTDPLTGKYRREATTAGMIKMELDFPQVCPRPLSTSH